MSAAARAFASAEKIIIATTLAQIEKHFRIVDVQTKFFFSPKRGMLRQRQLARSIT
ncbi:MAG: hypothetical protein WBL77_06705 [Pseudolabrys sp.]